MSNVYLNKRELIIGGSSALAILLGGRAFAQDNAFDVELQAFANDTTAIDDAHTVRERFKRVPGTPLSAQALSWKRASTHAISTRARALIITCEVSSQQQYEAKFQWPVLPGGESGITIGVGYDLGQVSAAAMRSDWRDLLSEATLSLLAPICGLKGEKARDPLKTVKDVVVPWRTAELQFDHFLPYAVGKTEDVFTNSSELSPSCLGALTSLIYNRGPSLSSTADSRREMREIAALTAARNFTPVPAKIREMRRLWEGDPKLRGLLERRELEAKLFEYGLSTNA